MIDSLEKLAQSCTFVVRNGEVTPLTDKSGRTRVLLSPGSIVDSKYEIVRLIGQGGMGVIYKVHHILLRKDVALKTFRSHGLSQDSWQRFQREAQAIAKLHHKNIVDVFDFGIAEEGLPYYTMELLTGQSLAEVLQKSGRLDPTEALIIFIQIAEALAHAHHQKIVHRDIKPANIFLMADSPAKSDHWQAKLVDFGIAKLAETTPLSGDQSQTIIGTIFGSPLYMSPEQSLGLSTDHRSDMYSFGCALYETLTGRPPLVGNTALITMLQHQTKIPPSLKDSGTGAIYPQRLEVLIARLLAKRPADRYQDFEQVRRELDWCCKAMPADLQSEAGALKHTAPDADTEEMDEASAKGPGISKALAGVLAVTVLLAGYFVMTSSILKRSYNQPTKTSEDTIYRDPLSNSYTASSRQHHTINHGQRNIVEVTRDSAGNKIFHFPPNPDLGSFSIQDDHQPRFCQDSLTVPANKQITFCPGSGLINQPQLFGAFGQAGLYGIKLAPDQEWSDKHIEAISHLPGLQKLDLSDAGGVTPQAVESISKMKDLKILDVTNTVLKGRDLVNLEILPNIEELTVSDLKDLTVLWQYLASQPVHLRKLVANHCTYDKPNFSAIGKIKSLLSFKATGSQINGSFLFDMTPATHLQELDLVHNPVDWGIRMRIGQYKELRFLYLTQDPKFFSTQDWEQLRRALPPNCKLVDPDPQ